MSKYYYLVASLPELTLEDNRLSYTVDEFKKEIYPTLSEKDKKVIELFYLKFDNANVLKLLQNKEAEIDLRGVYTAEELNAAIDEIKEGGEANSPKIASYLIEFLTAYFDEKSDKETLFEDQLAVFYYVYAMKNSNRFVSSWFEFNLNINNILIAFTARKYKWDVATSVIGQTEVCEALRTSGARDFGLTAEVDYLDQLSKINDLTELVDREKKLDVLRWNWMEDKTFFDYFTIERIFVFLLQLEMVERWIALDKERGSQLFRQIIDELKYEVQIPTEFKQKK